MANKIDYSKNACRITATVYGLFTWGKLKGQVNPSQSVTMTVHGECIGPKGKPQNAYKDAISKLAGMGAYTVSSVEPIAA